MQSVLTIGLVFIFCGSALAVSEDVRDQCDKPFGNSVPAIKACSEIIDTLDDASFVGRTRSTS